MKGQSKYCLLGWTVLEATGTCKCMLLLKKKKQTKKLSVKINSFRAVRMTEKYTWNIGSSFQFLRTGWQRWEGNWIWLNKYTHTHKNTHLVYYFNTRWMQEALEVMRSSTRNSDCPKQPNISLDHPLVFHFLVYSKPSNGWLARCCFVCFEVSVACLMFMFCAACLYPRCLWNKMLDIFVGD